MNVRRTGPVPTRGPGRLCVNGTPTQPKRINWQVSPNGGGAR